MRAFAIEMRLPFRGVTERRGLLVAGEAGWGEFSPFPEYDARTCAPWAAACLEAATKGFPAAVRSSIPVNATVPAVDAATAHDLVTRAGCSTVKVKVAEGDDVARVEAVRDALGPHGALRVDANGGWDVDEAATMIAALNRFDLEYVEQPVPTLEDMAELRKRVDVPLAADESVRTADDPLRVAGLEAADIVVLKVQPLGGVRRALDVAEACGLPTVVSSAVETSIGISMGLALAAALPELPYACGLATVQLLTGDVVASPLLPRNGALELVRLAVDEEAIAPYELRGRDRDAEIARFERAVAAAA